MTVADTVGFPILGTSHRSFANWSATGIELFGVALVLLLATDVGFVYLNRTREKSLILGPGFSEPMADKPGCFLSDPQVSVQLHTGYAFECSGGTWR